MFPMLAQWENLFQREVAPLEAGADNFCYVALCCFCLYIYIFFFSQKDCQSNSGLRFTVYLNFVVQALLEWWGKHLYNSTPRKQWECQQKWPKPTFLEFVKLTKAFPQSTEHSFKRINWILGRTMSLWHFNSPRCHPLSVTAAAKSQQSGHHRGREPAAYQPLEGKEWLRPSPESHSPEESSLSNLPSSSTTPHAIGLEHSRTTAKKQSVLVRPENLAGTDTHQGIRSRQAWFNRARWLVSARHTFRRILGIHPSEQISQSLWQQLSMQIQRHWIELKSPVKNLLVYKADPCYTNHQTKTKRSLEKHKTLGVRDCPGFLSLGKLIG